MPIYFCNPGHIDLDVIRTMGVSVKDNDNPIGYFGTGLKYAIATLLRNDLHVSLRSNGETVQFEKKPKTIRGKEFMMVYMDGEQLGFTTDLGRDWELWQAYRELYSNCMDEGGIVSGQIKEMDTIFTVDGPGIADIHSERSKIFLQTEPKYVLDGIDVHPGESAYLYYRGVRVHKLPKPSRFTYNFTCYMQLTEDRTLASTYDAAFKLGTRLPRCPDENFAHKLVSATKNQFESDLSFWDCHNPSEEFVEALEKEVRKKQAVLNDRLRAMLGEHRKVDDEAIDLTAEEMQKVRQACEKLRVLNCTVKPEDINFVEHLGPGIYGLAKDNRMYISRQTMANGVDFLAITIWEEWIHVKMGYPDCSRGMQQYLFDKILELIGRE